MGVSSGVRTPEPASGRIPQPDYRLRLGIMLLGVMILIWLSVEDQGTISVHLFGFVVAFVLLLQMTLRTYAGSPYRQLRGGFWLTMGGLLGVLTAITTTLLMFLKTALHSHVYPDYPVEMMLATLLRAPVWGMVGLLIVSGGLLIQRAAHNLSGRV